MRAADDMPFDPAVWSAGDDVNWKSHVAVTRRRYVDRYADFTRVKTNNYSELEEELANLTDAAEQAWLQQWDEKVLEMAEWLWSRGGQFLDLRGHVQDGTLLLTRAVEAARRLGDKTREEHFLGHLGRAWLASGDTKRATESFTQALSLARQIRDRQGEASHLGNLGQIQLDRGHSEKAADCFNQALKIAKEIGDRQMEGRLWASLGWLKLVKNTRQESIEAIADFRRAIQIAKRTGDRRGEASHLGSLGRAYELLGWNSWSLPPQVWGPDGYGESDYSKRCEQANKECYYRAYQYYSDARHVAVAIGDKQMEERFAADSRRAVSGGGFPTHSSGDLDWRIFSRNPMPDGLRSSSHWDLEPRLKKALVPPGHKR